MGSTGLPATWTAFRMAITQHFREKLEKRRARDDLETLRQTADVRAYTSEFHSIILDLPELDEETKRHRFLTGLKPEIQAIVEQQLPETLDRAVELATIADSVANSIKGRKTGDSARKPAAAQQAHARTGERAPSP